MKIFTPSHSQKEVELKSDATAKELAQELKLLEPQMALAAIINGKTKDLDTPLQEGDEVSYLSFDQKEGQEIFWHTSAHVLAQAVLRLFPEAKPTIGPPIAQGFYYDFANLTISETDLPLIEKEMKDIVKENYTSKREAFASKKEALDAFKENTYKLELISSFEEGAPLTAYRQGEFFDLCRGPHLPNLGKIKALKVLKTAGAYWRGDSKNEMLTRIYAISFPDRAQLKEYLDLLEEAKKRDHKILGPKLNLFSLQEEAPGMPFIHPAGMAVWRKLTEYLRQMLDKNDYQEIMTPTMMAQELWVRSGHWQNYRENMFTSEIEEREFAIKPMNCPGCMLYYRTCLHSYKELPLRIAEVGHVHRYEPSGSLSGLFRVRGFHQDDAHIFMTPDQIRDEVHAVLKFADDIYSLFGLKYRLELSTRPEKGTIGTDKEWDFATNALEEALKAWGRPYKINHGDGAFYGPKIDFHIEDAIKRSWQCGTVQLDMSLPEKFDLSYRTKEGTLERPVMIHRAIFGSIERFFGILIEHFAGKFPLWISPRQVRILAVSEKHKEYGEKVLSALKAGGFAVELDARDISVSKKVREAQLSYANYILTVGDSEMENSTVNVRTRDNQVHGEFTLKTLCTLLHQEVSSKSLVSTFAEEKK
jgi:threonyl-tRNA synthetase